MDYMAENFSLNKQLCEHALNLQRIFLQNWQQNLCYMQISLKILLQVHPTLERWNPLWKSAPDIDTLQTLKSTLHVNFHAENVRSMLMRCVKSHLHVFYCSKIHSKFTMSYSHLSHSSQQTCAAPFHNIRTITAGAGGKFFSDYF